MCNMQSYLLQCIRSIRAEIPTPGYHLVTFSYSSRYLSIEFLLSPSAISTYSIFFRKQSVILQVPMTVHREQSMKREKPTRCNN